jgi:hypothetical protein
MFNGMNFLGDAKAGCTKQDYRYDKRSHDVTFSKEGK